MRGATVGEPCNSLGLVAHRPEWCCVGFSVMGQNGPSCGTQTINTLLWSAFHIGYPHKQHHTTWHKKHSHAHAQTTHTHTHAQYNMHNFTNDSQTQEHVQYKGSEADNRAATWWNQTLQMRAAEDVQTCRQGEIERQTDREVCRY